MDALTSTVSGMKFAHKMHRRHIGTRRVPQPGPPNLRDHMGLFRGSTPVLRQRTSFEHDSGPCAFVPARHGPRLDARFASRSGSHPRLHLRTPSHEPPRCVCVCRQSRRGRRRRMGEFTPHPILATLRLRLIACLRSNTSIPCVHCLLHVQAIVVACCVASFVLACCVVCSGRCSVVARRPPPPPRLHASLRPFSLCACAR